MAGLTVCTGWHPAAWDKYARRFVETFARHWPADARLVAYTEAPVDLTRGECRSLWEIAGATEFIERHKHIPEHCGRAPTPHWRPKDHRNWLNAGDPAWRWDAVRFFKQCIIPAAVAESLPDDDALVWLDADVVCIADFPAGLIDRLLGGSDVCYLGRNKGAEIGFWAVSLNRRSRGFLADMSRTYLSDRVFGMDEFHSAYVWGRCRERAERAAGLSARDLTPGGRDHIFVDRRSPIMPYLDHLKGPRRKKLGYSPEHPMRWWVRAA